MPDTVTIREYPVTGMSCQHCVAAVTKELATIADVIDVQVDLVTGRVSITSGAPLDDAVVRAAIEEAGYEVSG